MKQLQQNENKDTERKKRVQIQKLVGDKQEDRKKKTNKESITDKSGKK